MTKSNIFKPHQSKVYRKGDNKFKRKYANEIHTCLYVYHTHIISETGKSKETLLQSKLLIEVYVEYHMQIC